MPEIVIINDAGQFWNGESYSPEINDARTYTDRSLAIGLASARKGRAIIGHGTSEQRELGNVPAPEPNPAAVAAVEATAAAVERVQAAFDVGQLTLDNYEDLMDERFRLTKAEKLSGISREEALRARIKKGLIKL